MITKEITLCGKQVTLGYCYATEIAYKDLTNEDMADYARHAVDSIQQQRDPDIKKTIFAIIACLMAYYTQKGEEAPVKDTDLMNEAKPAEIGMAIFAVIELRSQFYHVPESTQPKEKKKKGNSGKN